MPRRACRPSSKSARRLSRASRGKIMRRVHNWDEWIDYFRYWQDSLGLDRQELKQFKFEVKFGEPEAEAIEFGHYKGQRKWPTLMHIPDQRIRDALLNLIVYQGDTEFASVEQQR